MKSHKAMGEIFEEAKENERFIKVCAPMVRYSKLQFRSLVKRYGVDVCFTPMILADSFCQSSPARANEFTTSMEDTPLIAQFAAKTAVHFVDASKLVYSYVDGVDLNCGCPQRWALKDGYGCSLLTKPHVIYQLIRQCRNNFDSNFSISVKIRKMKDLKETINLCKQLEMCGVSFLTVHGRTSSQKSSEDVNVEALSQITQSLRIPVIANGGVKTLLEAEEMFASTKCAGVMAANGLLTNPALFTGSEKTPITCLRDWFNLKNKYKEDMLFQTYHHHLVFMLEKILTRQEKRYFNYLTKFAEVDNFLDSRFGIKSCTTPLFVDKAVVCTYPDKIVKKYTRRKCEVCFLKYCNCIEAGYDAKASNGKYFDSVQKQAVCDLDYMEGSLFEHG